MGRSTHGAYWNDVILEELIQSWQHYVGLTNSQQDVEDTLHVTRLNMEVRLDTARGKGDIVDFAMHTDLSNETLIVSIDLNNVDFWRGEFNCGNLFPANLIETTQGMQIDTKLPPPPTSSRPMTIKTMNIPVDPIADYDRAMKGVG